MNETKSASINVLIIFFLSYSFYAIQILSQMLFKYYSKQASFIICLFFLLSPIIVFFVCKSINRVKKINKEKRNVMLSILSAIYFLATSIISLVYISNIILIYYYQETSIILLLIFLALPLVYTLIKGEDNFFSLSSILLIIFVIFKYSYLKNVSQVDIYVFSNFFTINNSIVKITLLALPILLEPIILLNESKNISNIINIKFIMIFSILLSLIGVFTVLRLTWEFGSLLDYIHFPYLESAKNIMAGRFFENIDYYYLLSLSISVYIRLGYTLVSIKKSFHFNKKIIFLILFIMLFLVYLIRNNLQIAEVLTLKILLLSSIILVAYPVIYFIFKRRKLVYEE